MIFFHSHGLLIGQVIGMMSRIMMISAIYDKVNYYTLTIQMLIVKAEGTLMESSMLFCWIDCYVLCTMVFTPCCTYANYGLLFELSVCIYSEEIL